MYNVPADVLSALKDQNYVSSNDLIRAALSDSAVGDILTMPGKEPYTEYCKRQNGSILSIRTEWDKASGSGDPARTEIIAEHDGNTGEAHGRVMTILAKNSSDLAHQVTESGKTILYKNGAPTGTRADYGFARDAHAAMAQARDAHNPPTGLNVKDTFTDNILRMVIGGVSNIFYALQPASSDHHKHLGLM